MKQRKFPAFTSAERLSQYTSLDYKHAVPEVFHTFCQAALDSTATGSLSSSPMTRIDVNGVSVYLIEANFSSISAQSLQRADTSYSGAHLMICNMPEVRKRGGEVDKLFNFLAHYYNNDFSVLSMQECSLADAEEMAYTSRQLNSLSTGVQCFNIVVSCSVSQQHIIQEGIEKCFDSAEIAYCYKERASEEECTFITIANITYMV